MIGAAIMFWRAIKFITLSEIIGWVAFFVVVVTLGAFGIDAEKSGQVILSVLCFALFVAAYRFLNRRRSR